MLVMIISLPSYWDDQFLKARAGSLLSSRTSLASQDLELLKLFMELELRISEMIRLVQLLKAAGDVIMERTSFFRVRKIEEVTPKTLIKSL
ncbi:hypothetical protein PanWU01x14_099460 [Parasponia andersonii]|uniref:Uncharacterized protein n=1 Tax=Parasponia andersonii TaxID=3476 RepID=A0A2P5D3S5_PARAD|nr:hypothetical protein PanWU01x14_099460 [Parasponia andersonii]